MRLCCVDKRGACLEQVLSQEVVKFGFFTQKSCLLCTVGLFMVSGPKLSNCFQTLQVGMCMNMLHKEKT